jgi:hypothetical protein
MAPPRQRHHHLPLVIADGLEPRDQLPCQPTDHSPSRLRARFEGAVENRRAVNLQRAYRLEM